MRDNGRDQAHAIGGINDCGFDRCVRQREMRQALAGAHGRDAGEDRLGRRLRGASTHQCHHDQGRKENWNVKKAGSSALGIHSCAIQRIVG